jgi:hypothetical protein
VLNKINGLSLALLSLDRSETVQSEGS